MFLPGKFYVQSSLVGYSPKGHKELDMTEQLSVCLCMHTHTHTHTFPLGAFLVELVVKNLPANAGDAGEVGLIPWLGRSPGRADPLEEENGNLFQYSCLKNPMNRGAWWAIVQRVTKS